MHEVRVGDRTAKTQLNPVMVSLAVGLYLVGYGTQTIDEEIGMSESTLRQILRKMGLTRTQAQSNAAKHARSGKVHRLVRRKLIKRDYTRAEALKKQADIADRFNVSKKTIIEDRKAIGWGYTRREAGIVREWGSMKEYHQAQRRAAVLSRTRGWTRRRVGKELGVSKYTVCKMLDAYDERKG